MKIAYLINQYPRVSHSFIRREIAALESLGVEVERISIRPCEGGLADEADCAELPRTRAILSLGAAGLAKATIRAAVATPARFARAAVAAARLGRRSDRGLLRHFMYLAEACVLREWIARTRCDHVHAHFGTNSAAVAMLTRVLGGPTYSFTVHGPEEFDKPEFLGLASKIDRAAFVIGVCQFGRSQLLRWTPFEQWGRVHVIRCGVDERFLGASPAPVPSEPRLVCIGRLCEQKGQALLIEAAARLAEEGVDFELTLVGDGPMRPQIERAIDAHGLRNRVTITGWASSEEVRRRILAARAMVLPSFAEGLPVGIMEALALGRPVISTYVAGIPELVEPGVNGWLTPAGSIEGLVRAMREALSVTDARIEAMGRAGARKVAELHNVRTEARRLAALFAGAAGCESVADAAATNNPARSNPAIDPPLVTAGRDVDAS